MVTHEAGHAFASWLNRDRIPMDYIWPSMEVDKEEIHNKTLAPSQISGDILDWITTL